jgi:hypothetical protein
MTRERLERQFANALDKAPASLTREAAIALLRESLALVLEIEPKDVKAFWQDSEVRVELPSRCYLFDIDIIGKYVDNIALRVDVEDPAQLPDDDFIARMNRMRSE